MINDTEIYQDIPTWDNGTWTSTDFDTREDFAAYIRNLFKEPGQYAFDDVSYEFNAEATKFNTQGFYCAAPFKSRDFILSSNSIPTPSFNPSFQCFLAWC